MRTETLNNLILAVETSGRYGSVALGVEGKTIANKNFSAPMKHSSEIFPSIASLLDSVNKTPSDIRQVYISHGPGSFTGLRIAVTLAKTMHLADNSIKIISVDTLDCIALNADNYISSEKKNIQLLGVILDAKRGEFFTSVYKRQNEKWIKILDDCLLKPEQFLSQYASGSSKIHLLGEGLVYYSKKFQARTVEILDEKYWYPAAQNILKLGWEKALKQEFVDPSLLEPAYLRNAQPNPKRHI